MDALSSRGGSNQRHCWTHHAREVRKEKPTLESTYRCRCLGTCETVQLAHIWAQVRLKAGSVLDIHSSTCEQGGESAGPALPFPGVFDRAEQRTPSWNALKWTIVQIDRKCCAILAAMAVKTHDLPDFVGFRREIPVFYRFRETE